MPEAVRKTFVARLDDRGVVSVAGPDAVKFLQGLVTNDVAHLKTSPDALAFDAAAVHAGLLSPQGKILFDFFCVRTPDGFVLDVARDKAHDLAKRLSMYKLRAAADIKDAPDDFVCLALWGPNAASSGPAVGTVAFHDPRCSGLGQRILAEARFATDIASATNGLNVAASAYHAHRIGLGVAEGGKDYAFADTYPHEANFDLFNGVSFTKGCYVGQEVVSRMQNKTVVRKRVVKVLGSAPLKSGDDVLFGDVPIGVIGSAAGLDALAMLRLDRAIEAQEKGIELTAGGAHLTVDAAALHHYRTSLAAKAGSALPHTLA